MSPQVVGAKVGIWERFAAIPVPLENGLNEFFVFPGEPPKKNGHTAAFFGCKWPFHRTPEMGGRAQTSRLEKAKSLPGKQFVDLLVAPDLDEFVAVH